MTYGADFQLIAPDDPPPEIETAAPSAKGTAAKSTNKGADLLSNFCHKSDRLATTAFFWCRQSNSVQPIADLAAMVLA
jgi:hypothetical protein